MCPTSGSTGPDEIGHRDHSLTSEYRIFGPPGTGKTTNLARQVQRAVNRYGAHSVLVTSFSRSAAAELTGRDLPIPLDRIGTLHSRCYQALGRPAIAEANVDDWNKLNPHTRITPAKKHLQWDGEAAGEDESLRQPEGDVHLQQLSRNRGLMIPIESWPATSREFARRWTVYKAANGLMDFTDLIETALRDLAVAPNHPSVIFADEAQDLNRLQLKLVRKWGERAEYFIIALDDDQTIFAFAGASPEAVLEPPIPDDHNIFLRESYRVPTAVHRLANSLISQVTRRQTKEYLPRAAEGRVECCSGTWKSPEYSILKAAVAHLQRGQKIMFLASCSYMLRPVIEVLRRNNIPFHNPYRKSNGFWNPLRLGARGSSASRIESLLAPHPGNGEHGRNWTPRDILLWTQWCSEKGTLKPGAADRLRSADPSQILTSEGLQDYFESGALQTMLGCFNGDYRSLLDWWRRRLTPEGHKRSQFAATVAALHGPQALTTVPGVIVGTIHSVKGGEADVVFLFPDLSSAGSAQYAQFGPARDSVIRMFYVGITRAREVLYMADPVSSSALQLHAK